MKSILVKLFVKDHNNINDAKVRSRYGLLIGIFGIITNTLISIVKIIFGFIFVSIALISDGINNLGDSLSSIVTMIGLKAGNKAADKDHPFGHQRLEYISALIISMIIMSAGVTVLKSSIESIIEYFNHISNLNIDNIVLFLIILGISILIKLWQLYLYLSTAKILNSLAVKADAIDALSDLFTTTGVLISGLLYYYGNINIDGIVGALISIYIIVQAISLMKTTIDPLLGSNPTQEEVNRIISIIKSYEGVLSVHDLVIHNYGPSTNYVTVHVGVSSADSITKSHDLIDRIEKDFKQKMDLNLTIHMDPVDLNSEYNDIEILLQNIISSINSEYKYHDFHIKKEDNNLVLEYDLVLDNKQNIDENELKNRIESELNNRYEGSKRIITKVTFDIFHNSFDGEK